MVDQPAQVISRAGTATITGSGIGSTAGDPIARLRSARVVLRAPGARRTLRAGRILLLRRMDGGRTTLVSGRLLDARGRAIVGADIQVRGHRGRVIGRGLTRRGGAFSIRVRPIAGGLVRLTVPVGRSAVVLRTTADLRLQVRPRLALAASSGSALAGEQIVFSGRIHPAPAALGLGGRKGVTLEWRDPIRRAWRPVVNAHLRADGTFAIPWSFNLLGLTIPMRVTVGAETGWPLLPVRSHIVPVTIRENRRRDQDWFRGGPIGELLGCAWRSESERSRAQPELLVVHGHGRRRVDAERLRVRRGRARRHRGQ
jgi:hypothetical protein